MAEFGRSATLRGRQARPKLLGNGAFPKEDFPRNISLEEFDRIRWAHVDLQLAKVAESWDGEEVVYAIITVEVGASDYKKVGLVLRAQHLTGESRAAFTAHHAKMTDLLRGKSGRSAGDMDDLVEVNSKEELCAEEIKKKSRILQEVVSLTQVRIDGPSTSIRSSGRHSASSVSTTASSGQGARGTGSASGSAPRPDLIQLEEQRLTKTCQEMKNSGLSKEEVLEMLSRIWHTLPAPPRRSETASAGTSQAAPRTSERSQCSDANGHEDLISALTLARESPDLAYCMFHFVF